MLRWVTPPSPVSPYSPWAHTLVYYPFAWDSLDYSGNHYSLSWFTEQTSWTQIAVTPDYETLTSWLDVAKLNVQYLQMVSQFTWTPTTISAWGYKSFRDPNVWNDPDVEFWKAMMWQTTSDSNPWWRFRMFTWSDIWGRAIFYQGSSWNNKVRDFVYYQWQWIHRCVTTDGTYTYFYVDWVLQWSVNETIPVDWNLWMWTWPFDHAQNKCTFYWYISDVIIEDQEWSAQKIANYYDDSKWLYGIS